MKAYSRDLKFFMIQNSDIIAEPISGQCFHFISPKNTRMVRNGLK